MKVNAQYVVLERRAANTNYEKLLKLEQLEKVIAEAQDEASELRTELQNGSIFEARDAPGETSKVPSILYEHPECIKAFLETGLMNFTQMQSFYRMFIEKMAPYVPFYIDLDKPIEIVAKDRPIFALSMVITSSAITQPATADVMTEFLEKLISEQMLLVQPNAVDVIKGLILYHMYLQPKPEQRMPIYLLTAVSLATAVDLGSKEDISVLIMLPPDNSATFGPRERIQTYLSLYQCVIAMAIHTSRPYLLKLLPNSPHNCEPLLKKGMFPEKFALLQIQLLLTGDQFHPIWPAVSDDNLKADAIAASLAEQRRKLDDLREAAEFFVGEDKSLTQHLLMFRSSHEMISLAIIENAMNQLVYGEKTPVNSATVTGFISEMLRLCHGLIDGFVALEDHIIPKFMYYRPLFAITSMIRIRLLLWSQGLELHNTDVDEQFARVKQAWERATTDSITGKRMHDQLMKVERWMQLRMQPGALKVNDDDSAPSNALLQKIIRDIILDIETDKRAQTQKSQGFLGSQNRHLFSASNNSLLLPGGHVSPTTAGARTPSVVQRTDIRDILQVPEPDGFDQLQNGSDLVEGLLKDLFSEVVPDYSYH
ncbi:hypothetical protein TRVA0_007S03862 [Trichomonascus vanleenenianus]|uniref:uncharacterized protein n=1 Tax=Trichomonascus vanleenenianus TaxID=2268995 RepID=UPI003EC9F451